MSGVAAGRPLTTSFQPPLAFQLDDTALRLTQPNGNQGELQPSHHAAIPHATEVPATLDVLGVGLRVDDVRSLALLVGLLAAAAAWLMYLLMRKASEPRWIASRALRPPSRPGNECVPPDPRACSRPDIDGGSPWSPSTPTR